MGHCRSPDFSIEIAELHGRHTTLSSRSDLRGSLLRI